MGIATLQRYVRGNSKRFKRNLACQPELLEPAGFDFESNQSFPIANEKAPRVRRGKVTEFLDVALVDRPEAIRPKPP